jgi:hypothetical protein
MFGVGSLFPLVAASLFPPAAAAAWHLHARRSPRAPNRRAAVAASDWTASRRLQARARACQGLCRTRVGLPGRLRRAREVAPWPGTAAVGHVRLGAAPPTSPGAAPRAVRSALPEARELLVVLRVRPFSPATALSLFLLPVELSHTVLGGRVSCSVCPVIRVFNVPDECQSQTTATLFISSAVGWRIRWIEDAQEIGKCSGRRTSAIF